jgi:hypothetical protein
MELWQTAEKYGLRAFRIVRRKTVGWALPIDYFRLSDINILV